MILVTEYDPQAAASLAARFAGWNIWHGRYTGLWWAVPPAGYPHSALVDAADLHELARKIQAVEDGRDLRWGGAGPRALRLRPLACANAADSGFAILEPCRDPGRGRPRSAR
jgi:hypothetical protein